MRTESNIDSGKCRNFACIKIRDGHRKRESAFDIINMFHLKNYDYD